MKVQETKTKIKKFWKDNKDGIIAGTLVVSSVVLLVCVGKYSKDIMDEARNAELSETRLKELLNSGKLGILEEVLRTGAESDLAAFCNVEGKYTFEDMGKMGEDILKGMSEACEEGLDRKINTITGILVLGNK